LTAFVFLVIDSFIMYILVSHEGKITDLI